MRFYHALLTTLIAVLASLPCSAGETLYNGIELPDEWPPRDEVPNGEPMQVPYLDAPPAVIPIDVGRQLFVDDFLIEATDLKRSYHRPNYHPDNPILKADRPWELETDSPGAGPFSDGVWYDPADQLFKLWYVAPVFRHTCLATSKDGVHWEKPDLDVTPGTNIVHPVPDGLSGRYRDSSTVWLDPNASDPSKRFLLFNMASLPQAWSLRLHYSEDGVHWSEPAATSSRPFGDRTTAFYNPFRDKWVISVRTNFPGHPRARAYLEGNDPIELVHRAPEGAVPWTSTDRLDPHNPNPEFADIAPQLYNLDAAPYESLMLGLFSVWEGPPNAVCAERGIQKRNEVLVGFSRDGFHWYRPDRRPFLGVNEEEGAWNWGNVQSAGGGCVVVGDQLYFYVSGRGLSDKFWDGNMHTGLATLRRDGFASLDAGEEPGTLTTRPLRFSGKHLFVNVAAADGELRCEMIDDEGRAIEPFIIENCQPLSVDNTKARVEWRGADNLSAVAGKEVRVRFRLRQGELYAFWVSEGASGESGAYVNGTANGHGPAER